jgi:tRNA threonylcarbamoyladenosine biosynthesis protein TsaB
MILAIDTATQYAALALYRHDGIFAEEAWYAGRNHTIELMPRIVRMLKLAELKVIDLDALAVSLGPGSFTGMALPHKLPVIGVPTLDVEAYPLRDRGLPVWAIAQAGRGRILAACYADLENQWQVVNEPHLTNFETLASKISNPVLCTGEIKQQGAQMLASGSGRKARVVSPAARLRRAAYLAEIAAARLEANSFDDPNKLVPIYPKSL